MPYLSHQTTRTPTIYLHSALPVPTNHTHSHYIPSQCPTCPTKSHALPLYTFTVPYLSHQTTRTPTIYLHSTLPVPTNHTHSHYIYSQCPTCPTKSHALPLYTFTVPYLSHQTTRTPTIHFHTALPVPPNPTHSHYIPSQHPTCPTKPHTLPLYTFTAPYLSHQTTRTPTLYLYKYPTCPTKPTAQPLNPIYTSTPPWPLP